MQPLSRKRNRGSWSIPKPLPSSELALRSKLLAGRIEAADLDRVFSLFEWQRGSLESITSRELEL